MNNNKVALLGIMLSLSIILSYFESLIPVITYVPGIKIGIANIITMYILYKYSAKEAFIIMLLRVIISGFMFSGLNTIIFGLLGGVICIILMSLAKSTHFFSVMGISIIGAVAHNLGQIIAAFIIMDNVNIIFYFPILSITAVFSGLLVGLISAVLIKRFQNI